MLLSEAVDGYLLFKSSRASPNTIETDRYVLGAFLGWLGDDVTVDAVDADTVRAYLAHEQARGLAASTVVRTHATISALFVWLADPEVGLAAANPARAVNPPRIPKLRPRALTAEQVTALVAACGETTLPRRDRAVVLFLLDTGARASELAGVTDRDVDLKTGKVRVMGKGAKERFVYLGKRALSALWLYLHDERPEHAQANDEHLFLTQSGYPMTRYTLGSLIARVSEIAGFHAHPHQLRHTAAIARLRNGMDLISLQRMLGHETLEVTRAYLTALNDEDVEQAATRTSPADSWRL